MLNTLNNIMKICQWCKEKETKRKFCSRECFGEFRADRRKRYYKENKERALETHKKYVEENKEKVLKYNKEWREKNCDHVKEYNSKYTMATKEKKAEYWKEYYSKNKEKIISKKKEYEEKLSPEIKEKRRNKINEQKKKSYLESTYRKSFKVKIRRVVSNAFSKRKIKKPSDSETILGCSLEEAKHHIEKLFLDGMSWDNHGEWHIDHIKPLATVDDNDVEGILELNKIENLRPIWAFENLSKGAYFEGVNYRYNNTPSKTRTT